MSWEILNIIGTIAFAVSGALVAKHLALDGVNCDARSFSSSRQVD